jgi:uncharacterized damage-inducible protein DinB
VDLLDRLLQHDAWTTAQFLVRCQELTVEQLDRRFDIGHGSVRATFEHIIFNMEVWSHLMAGHEPLPADREQSLPAFTHRLDRAALIPSGVARHVAARDGWDETWLDVLDDPPTRKTYGGAIAHVITHSMHHRAQLLWMLRQLGLQGLPEGDVFSWERQAMPASPNSQYRS